MSKHDSQLHVADSLRREGFIPLPRLWVKPEDIPKIHKIAHVHADRVNTIRNNVTSTVSENDPVKSKEAAWDEHERVKNKT
jgi:hypothetical protein